MDAAMPTQNVETGRAQVLHRIVDGEARVDAAAGGVDVHEDVPLLGLPLPGRAAGRRMMLATLSSMPLAEKDDAVHEQPTEDVVAALAPAGPLDDVRRIDGHAWVLSVAGVSWPARR